MTDPTVVEDQRRAAEAEAIGPTGSAVLHAAGAFAGRPLGGRAVFFKVHWTPVLEHVSRLVRGNDGIDSLSQWTAYGQEGIYSASVEIQWKGIGAVVLYFGPRKWRAELEMIAASGLGFLTPETAKGYAMVKRGIGVDLETDVPAMLATQG